MGKFLKYWLPLIVWATIIFSFSSRPTGTASEFDLVDFIIKKTAHLVEYAILAVLLYRGLINSNIKKSHAIVASVIFSFLYGFTDEFHQFFTPGREPRLRDVIIDTIGAIGGLWIVVNLLPKAPRRLAAWGKKLDLL